MGQCSSGNKDRRRGRSDKNAPTSSQATAGPSPAVSSRYVPDMHYLAPTREIVWVPQKPLTTERGYILLQPKNMGERALRNALEFMANIIHSKHNENITVITIGGAMNVLLLQEQNETDDVDIMGTNLSTYHLKVLAKAATATHRANEASLGPQWFNNHALALIQTDIHEHVTKKALAQNEVIFHKPGLTLIAAPWNYAFCCAIARALKIKPNHPPHVDILNAVRYLRRYTRRHGNRAVQRRTITDWLISVGTMDTDKVLRTGLGVVAKCYQHQYGEEGIRGLSQSDREDSTSWYALVRPRDRRRDPLYNILFGHERGTALDIEFRQGALRDPIGNIELRQQDSPRESICVVANVEVPQRQGASRDPIGNIEARQQDSSRERRGANIEARYEDNIPRRFFLENPEPRRQDSPRRSAGNTEPRSKDEQRQRREPIGNVEIRPQNDAPGRPTGNIEPRSQEGPSRDPVGNIKTRPQAATSRDPVGNVEARQQDSPPRDRRGVTGNIEARQQDSPPRDRRGATGNIEPRRQDSPRGSAGNIEITRQDSPRPQRGVTGNIEPRQPSEPPKRSIGNVEFTSRDSPRERSGRSGAANLERRSPDERRAGTGRAQRDPTGSI